MFRKSMVTLILVTMLLLGFSISCYSWTEESFIGERLIGKSVEVWVIGTNMVASYGRYESGNAGGAFHYYPKIYKGVVEEFYLLGTQTYMIIIERYERPNESGWGTEWAKKEAWINTAMIVSFDVK